MFHKWEIVTTPSKGSTFIKVQSNTLGNRISNLNVEPRSEGVISSKLTHLSDAVTFMCKNKFNFQTTSTITYKKSFKFSTAQYDGMYGTVHGNPRRWQQNCMSHIII